MLKVLIADDEIKVCRLIQYLIDWKAMGLEVVGIVNDGLSAFDFIKNNNPDIVITDIRMPGYNGLELIKNAKEFNPNIHFIIISGYSYFDYAYNAIKYGVEDFLLKPLKKKELTQALSKLIKNHHIIMEDRTEKENMRKRIDNDIEKLKSNLLNQMIENPGKFEKNDAISKINEEYYCQFKESFFEVLIIQPMTSDSNREEQNYSLLISKTKDIIYNELYSFYNEIIITSINESIFCLLNGSEEQFGELKKQLKKIRVLIIGLKDVFQDVKGVMALSSVTHDFHNVCKCIEEAKLAVLDKIFVGTGAVIEYQTQEKLSVKIEDIIDNQYRQDFTLHVEILNLEGINKCIEGLKKHIMSMNIINGKLVLNVYREVINLYCYATKTYGILIETEKLQKELLEDFPYYLSIDQVFDNLIEKLSENLLSWMEKKKLENSKPIRLAKQYINEHYNQALTLEMLGVKIGLNPTYFSTVFKKETGKSFIDYVTEVRIQNAKQLLLDTDLSILEIAEDVGYNDLKYFSKGFKKATGLSPTDYRKLYN